MKKHHQTRSTMRKEGPCCHCGIKETPLWRNGPPKKPVLCNACGSRWRIRGNLDDYVPNKRGTVVRRGKKRSKRVYYNPSKWIDHEDDDDEEDSHDEEESDHKERNRRQKTRHGGSGSESVTTITSEEPGKLYDVVVQSGIIINDEEDEKDGSDDSHVAVEELKLQDNYAEIAWTPSHDDDEDWPLAHIKKLQMELYEMFKNEKSSSSSSSSQCSSFGECPMEEDEVLLYNLSNPHFSENEVGFGSVLLKPPHHKCNEAI